MSSQLAFIAQRMFNTPLAIHPDKAEIIMGALAERMGIVSFDRFDPRPAQSFTVLGDDDDDEFSREGREMRGYDVVDDIAVIAVQGTLVYKLRSLRPFSGMTGYAGIRTNFTAALSDPQVKGIMFDIQSPGGEVSGLFDLCDFIYENRNTKPLAANLTEYAYSAAYAIASCCPLVTCPRTGGAGSIGAIWLHADLSKMIKSSGIKISMVQFGERKTDGRPEIPLSPEARARVQGEIDLMGNMFVDLVARNRGMERQKVVDTQAGSFMGQEAVNIGLVDHVAAPDTAFRIFRQSIDS